VLSRSPLLRVASFDSSTRDGVTEVHREVMSSSSFAGMISGVVSA